jgi:hypothetical protein
MTATDKAIGVAADLRTRAAYAMMLEPGVQALRLKNTGLTGRRERDESVYPTKSRPAAALIFAITADREVASLLPALSAER